MTVERPAVYIEGDEVRYRASSLGSCTRALAAARQELEPWQGKVPEGVQAAWDRGNEAEPKVLEALKGRGWIVGGSQAEVTLLLTNRLWVVGHVDGVATDEIGQNRVVEAKRQNDDEWAKGSIKESMFWGKYQWQFSAYMLATRYPLIVGRCSDQGEIKWEEFLTPPRTGQEVLARVLSVEMTARQDLKGVECDSQDFPCPYWRLLHPGRGADEVERYEVEDSELASWVVHYARASDDAREVEKVRKSLRTRILERVKVGITRDRGTGVAVKVTVSDVRERVVPAGTRTIVTPILEKGGERETGEGVDDGDG